MKLFRFSPSSWPSLRPLAAQTPDVDACSTRPAITSPPTSRTFVGVVAEETYRQEVRGSRRHRPARVPGGSPRPAARSEVRHAAGPRAGRRPLDPVSRRLRSGRQAGARSRRAAGEAVPRSRPRRRSSRWTTSPTASARYNIGGVNRNINLPVLALTVLEPQNRAWFLFKGRQEGRHLFDLEFREERGGTLIRTRRRSVDAVARPLHDRSRHRPRAVERADCGKRRRCGRAST